MLAAVFLAAVSFDLPAGEFVKYHRAVTGRDPAPEAVRFSVDPSVSVSGNDAYVIRSEGSGVRITGSNLRSVFYGVYDLLERRAGCRWFWDGDRVPKRAHIDLSGLDVREEARFEYRGLRYFAHRGLTRFQAEHWGPEEWKREIDWCLKRRLNCFMPRIGMDDTWQRAYPDTVPYPPPDADPEAHGLGGYNDRRSYWGLRYRGELRRLFTAYAFDRGLMIPTDFGTMTHWYSRTPTEFLEKYDPPFLPQANENYNQRTGLVWDIFQGPWLDRYWHLTETFVNAGYGNTDLLHTIGLGERMCFKDRSKNLQMKKDVLAKITARALKARPDAKILLAGWDFYCRWEPDEVRSLLGELDAKNTVIWDYECDAEKGADHWQNERDNDFTQWGVIGRFPYTFGIFLAYEHALDVRARYGLIEARERLVANDPMCRGYILWPESSHTDTFLLRYFTANAWRPGQTHDALLPAFCQDRYGSAAAAFESVWRKVIPLSGNTGWGNNWCEDIVHSFARQYVKGRKVATDWPRLQAVPEILRDLSTLELADEFQRRDAFDLARTVTDRLLLAVRARLLESFDAWRSGKADMATVGRQVDAWERLVDATVDILALHTDCSLYESLCRLGTVAPCQQKDFDRILLENASNYYCLSHQYETAKGWCRPLVGDIVGELRRKLAAGDSTPLMAEKVAQFADARKKVLYARGLAAFRPTAPRTAAEYRQVLKAAAAAADFARR